MLCIPHLDRCLSFHVQALASPHTRAASFGIESQFDLGSMDIDMSSMNSVIAERVRFRLQTPAAKTQPTPKASEMETGQTGSVASPPPSSKSAAGGTGARQSPGDSTTPVVENGQPIRKPTLLEESQG